MNDLKVLVVDDESRMRKLVRDFLVKDGYSVVEAADGEEAVDIFMSDKDISLIILDVMMPKLDGYGVAEEVRKLSDVPIIMLTAKSDEKDELRGFDLGIDEYISKFCELFGYDSQTILNSKFTKIVPDSKNPYKQMYVTN